MMGSMYSAEAMEHNSPKKSYMRDNDRNSFDRVRIPFKLLCDNTSQTDGLEIVPCKCMNEESKGGAGSEDESQINFTSVYLSCHETPTKDYCDSVSQTEISTVSLGIQTDDMVVLESARKVDMCVQTDVANPLDYKILGESIFNKQAHRLWNMNMTASRHDMSLISFKYDHDNELIDGGDDDLDLEADIDAIEEKYLSSISENEYIGDREKYNFEKQLQRERSDSDSPEESYSGYTDRYLAPSSCHDSCREDSSFEDDMEMQQLLDVDYCARCDFLQRENKNMKEIVEQYEDAMKELNEQNQDMILTDVTLNETLNEKEQLQTDLNKAENSLMDAYKRIERLKSAVDKYKQNEDNMKYSIYDFQGKLIKSEERYQKLKKQAVEKIDAANSEIIRVRKEKDIELAVIQAALQKARNRNTNIEKELEQKVLANKELSSICDELITKVSSGDG